MRNPAYVRVLSRVVLLMIGVGAVLSAFALRAWSIRPPEFPDPWAQGARSIELAPGGGARATVERDGLLCSLEISNTVVLVGDFVTSKLTIVNVSEHPKNLGVVDMGWIVPDSATAPGYTCGLGGGYSTGPPQPGSWRLARRLPRW